MSAIIAAVSGSGFFGIGFCGIYPPCGATYTQTYADQPGKDLQVLPDLTRKIVGEGLNSLERQEPIRQNGSTDKALGSTEISGHTPMMQQCFLL